MKPDGLGGWMASGVADESARTGMLEVDQISDGTDCHAQGERAQRNALNHLDRVLE